jgi:hypothetical protein
MGYTNTWDSGPVAFFHWDGAQLREHLNLDVDDETQYSYMKKEIFVAQDNHKIKI